MAADEKRARELESKYADVLPGSVRTVAKGIDLILALYRVEHEAQEQEIVGTRKHLQLRRKKSALVRSELEHWLKGQKPLHPPKSAIGKAIRYGLNPWVELGRFLEDP